MAEPDFEKLTRLATVAASDLGTSEEEVKVNFAVPLLEALGHSRLRLEYKQKDIVVHSGGRRPLSVVVETKRAGEPLDRHLAQLERYAAEQSCFLALLTNGDELRFYTLPWPGVPSFEDALVWEVRREELASPALARDLAACLGADAMASGEAADVVAARQAELDSLREKLLRLEDEAQARRDGIRGRLRELDRDDAAIERERAKLRTALQEVDACAEAATAELYASAAARRTPRRRAPAAGSLPAASPTSSAAPQPAAPPAPRPSAVPAAWRDEELFGCATELQRRIFALFARSGRWTLGSKELAAQTGLSPLQLKGALSGFANAAKRGTREPLFEITRPVGRAVRATGVLFTLVEKYRDTIARLYPS